MESQSSSRREVQKGFSPRNLWDMRRLSESIRDCPKLRQLVAEIPWGHKKNEF